MKKFIGVYGKLVTNSPTEHKTLPLWKWSVRLDDTEVTIMLDFPDMSCGHNLLYGEEINYTWYCMICRKEVYV